jgi:hypothetical protein
VTRSRAALEARRAELIAQSGAYREEVAAVLDDWHAALDRVDRVMRIVGQVRRVAPWLGMALGGAMFLVPKGAAAWIGRAQNAWKSIGSIVSIAAGLRG